MITIPLLYLEINGHIPWIGSLQFSAEDFPKMNQPYPLVMDLDVQLHFEFDSDYTATATEIGTVEKMYVLGGGSLISYYSFKLPWD